MDEEKLVPIKIPTARQKLKVNFPQDPKGDFSLVFKTKVFKLQKPHLRLESGYFKRVCKAQTEILQIREDFNQQFFYNVMFCFYGATIHVKKNDIPKYYPIVRFLQVDSLLSFLKKDMIDNINHYQLFLVMKIAHRYSEQDLYEACLQQLESQAYEQLNYGKYELMETQPSLFKLIIKMHNRYKNEKGTGLSYVEIDQLLREYCQSQNLVQGKYQQFKFQLIDKTALSSTQYKEIFLDEAIKLNKASGILDQYQNKNPAKSSLTSFGKNNKLAESFVSPNQKMNTYTGFTSSPNIGNISSNVSNELQLQMKITYERKVNKELEEQNELLFSELELLKKTTSQNNDIHDQMQNELKILKEELKKKETFEKEHKKKIIQFQGVVNIMRRELDEKSQIIDKLVDQFEDLKNRRPNLMASLEEDQDKEEMIVQSQFLPAHLIGEMMPTNKPPPKKVQAPRTISKPQSTIKQQNESLDQIELQELYAPRLEFDIEPISTPKIHYPKIIDFICADDFNKKMLKLVYRRSSSGNVGKSADLRNRKNLLILIKTTTEQNIGGYISVTIPSNCGDYVSDPGAIIFTFTKNQKFGVKKSDKNQAIFVSDLYVISFANDLMISNDCLNEGSYCSWPSSYEGNKNIKERGPTWLVGDSDFYIKDLDVYEIDEQNMEMVL